MDLLFARTLKWRWEATLSKPGSFETGCTEYMDGDGKERQASHGILVHLLRAVSYWIISAPCDSSHYFFVHTHSLTLQLHLSRINTSVGARLFGKQSGWSPSRITVIMLAKVNPFGWSQTFRTLSQTWRTALWLWASSQTCVLMSWHRVLLWQQPSLPTARKDRRIWPSCCQQYNSFVISWWIVPEKVLVVLHQICWRAADVFVAKRLLDLRVIILNFVCFK